MSEANATSSDNAGAKKDQKELDIVIPTILGINSKLLLHHFLQFVFD